MATTKHSFYVVGMHCSACVLLTESELQDVPEVSGVCCKLETRTVDVSGDFGDRDAATVASELSQVLTKHGYRLSTEKTPEEKKYRQFLWAAPAAAAIIVGFFGLQRLGLADMVSGERVNYATAFVIGVIASLSTCLAVVGGLVLSLSATYAKQGNRTRPQALFHLGRLSAFFLFGGLVGVAGSALRPSQTVTTWLGIVVGLVMVVLGINLLEVFDWAKRLQPALPKSFGHRAMGAARKSGMLAPLLAGAVTFFLPCGFTQSMQLFALSTGSFIGGGLFMLAFALGTLPVLALISFSSFSMQAGASRGVFFKTAGIVVLFFALYSVVNGLVAVGVLPSSLIF